MSLFDYVVTRDAHCRKYGQLQQMFGTDDVLPLWIADMDFKTPQPIIDTLRSVVTEPVQGYNLDHPTGSNRLPSGIKIGMVMMSMRIGCILFRV